MSRKFRDATLEDMHKKTWHIKDLKRVSPISDAQHDMFKAFDSGNLIGAGTAGTGKTYLAMYLAFRLLLSDDSFDCIRIVRSAVETRDLGHKPGKLEEKLVEFEAPYKDICQELFGRWSTYEDMKDAHLIKFNSTSDIRGLTWRNSIVIIDEIENLNYHEIDSCMTRIGKNTKVVLVGDIRQTDLLKSNRDTTGMNQLLKVAEKMPSITIVRFDKNDIVRSDFVREWIEACEATE